MSQANAYGLDMPYTVNTVSRGNSDMTIHKAQEKTEWESGSKRMSTKGSSSPLRARVLKLALFIVIELLWLGFGLFAGLHSPTIKVRLLFFLGHRFGSDVVSKSALSFIGNMYQLFAMVFAGGIISNTFASEWKHLLGPRERIEHNTTADRVSLLTSGFLDKLPHAWKKGNSTRHFRLAFVVSLMLPLLHSVMNGTVSIGPSTSTNITETSIGSLPSSTFFTSGDPDQTKRLLQLAARNAYAVEIDNDFLNYNILNSHSSNSILFGMPPRDLTQKADFIGFSSDAASYQYICKWVQPTFEEFYPDIETPSITTSLWSLDDSGVLCTVDSNSFDAGNNINFVSSLYGFWPLVNADNFEPFSGSLAWLLLGGNSSKPLSVLDISSIPEESRTFNASGWFDLVPGRNETDSYLTTLASVLLCDPNIQYGSVDVEIEFSVIDPDSDILYSPNEQGGQIDHTGAEWMFSLGLNGVPFDSVLTQLPLFNNSLTSENDSVGTSPGGLTDMSRLLFELAFEAPKQDGLGATLQELSNISKSLDTYMTIVGANVFLDGSLGNVSSLVEAQTSDISKQQLIISWTFWLTGVILLFIVSTLLTVLVAIEGEMSEVLGIGKVVIEVEERNGSI